MSWSLKLTPLLLACACGGTTLTSNADDSGAGGAPQGGSGGDESGGTSAGGAAGSSGGKVGSGGSAGAAARPGAGGTVGRVPMKHRPAEVVCGVRPPSPADAQAPSGPLPPEPPCTADSECTSGPNGRCVSGRIGPHCTYDACFNDSDCSAGAVCLCRSAMSEGSRCSTAGCRLDADCPGSFCSPTFGTCGNYSGVVGYACHSKADECVDDADCAATAPGGYCMHDPMIGHWICGNSQCAG